MTAASDRPPGAGRRPAPRRSALRVRRVTPEEYRTAGEVTVAAYRRLLGDDLGPDYVRELVDVATRDAVCPVLVALDGEDLIGAVTYVPGPDNPYAEFDDPQAAAIRHLAVRPAAQGRGAARALLSAAITRARAEGRQRLLLHSTPPMVRAQQLYLRNGFLRTPELDWSSGHIILLAYTLDLSAGTHGGHGDGDHGD